MRRVRQRQEAAKSSSERSLLSPSDPSSCLLPPARTRGNQGIKILTLVSHGYGSRFHLCHSIAVRPQASDFASLILSFLISKVGIIIGFRVMTLLRSKSSCGSHLAWRKNQSPPGGPTLSALLCPLQPHLLFSLPCLRAFALIVSSACHAFPTDTTPLPSLGLCLNAPRRPALTSSFELLILLCLFTLH